MENEQNLFFEGTHSVLTFHRRGSAPFVRRIEPKRVGVSFYPGGHVYAIDEAHIVTENFVHSVALVLDGEGRVRRSILGADETFAAGIVVDRSGTMYALREDGRTNHRLLTIDETGKIVRDIPLYLQYFTRLTAIDLAFDQCTLFYAGRDLLAPSGTGSLIGRVNVCTGVVLPPFATNLPHFPSDLRLTRTGELILVDWKRLVKFDRAGNILSELPAPADDLFLSVALDPDPRYLWIGLRQQLVRIAFPSGEVVERIPVYGGPSRLSVVGEPRAARLPQLRPAPPCRILAATAPCPPHGGTTSSSTSRSH